MRNRAHNGPRRVKLGHQTRREHGLDLSYPAGTLRMMVRFREHMQTRHELRCRIDTRRNRTRPHSMYIQLHCHNHIELAGPMDWKAIRACR